MTNSALLAPLRRPAHPDQAYLLRVIASAGRLDERRRLRGVAGAAIAPIFIILLACLGHSFPGIVGDSILYIGRGLADVDPQGVGRDLMFENDGQSRFSLLPLLTRWLISHSGPASADLVLVLAAQSLWLAAIFMLARGLVGRGLVTRSSAAFWPCLICVSVLPNTYGPFERLGFDEPLGIPRPFAEAFVLFALAALLRKRDLLAALLLVLAALIHPIMALSGAGLAFGLKSLDDRRWLFAGLAIAVIALLASFLDAPLLGRLFLRIDPEWRAINVARNPLLFPSLWDSADFGRIVVQAVTVMLAARQLAGRARAIFLFALIVGLGGLAASWIFGDGLSSLLIVQAQPWRALWLMAVLATIGFAICGVGAAQAMSSRIAFLLLVAAWAFIDEPIVAIGAALGSLIAGTSLKDKIVSDRVVRLLSVFAAMTVLVFIGRQLFAYYELVAALPAGFPLSFAQFWNLHVLSLPLALIAIGAIRVKPIGATPIMRGVGLVAMAVFVFYAWDARSPARKSIDADRPPADAIALIAERPGSVLWLGGIEEATYWLRRPNWYSALQGTSAIFSRELALAWRNRAETLIALGLLPAGDTGRPIEAMVRPMPIVSPGQIDKLCSRSDAPAWIVLPVLAGSEDPAGLRARIWVPPVPVFKPVENENGLRWMPIAHYLFMPCQAGIKAD